MLELAANRERQGWVDRRDKRVKVLVRVSLRGPVVSRDACIRDVSRHGMLLQADLPPSRGAVIEVMGPFSPVVARVVWASERRFGVITQGRINVSDFFAGKGDTPGESCSARSHAAAQAGWERGERSRHFGRLLQYAAVIGGSAVLALALSQAAYKLLSNVASSVEAGL